MVILCISMIFFLQQLSQWFPFCACSSSSRTVMTPPPTAYLFLFDPKPTHHILPKKSHKWRRFFISPPLSCQTGMTQLNWCVWRASASAEQQCAFIYKGDPSRVTTDEPPSFSARVCRSFRSSKPFTCHSCLMPEGKREHQEVFIV